ncbi:MAG: hypothetical protein COB27_013630 [Moritella sp.]|uniref:DUF6776 family protein n=1 Tax=unclassified Moritella TaxID=2637987 RepID=UPI0001569764|nr:MULTISPECIES: DUF6776 family protein [unclassified Moritella]EDM66427.1 Uncharacterized conserved membrane or secreted protein [Moritella sp. PE36]MBL1417901.1 hypothetical protein [Moritella sp.]
MFKIIKPRYIVLLALAILLGYGFYYLKSMESAAKIVMKDDEISRLNTGLAETTKIKAQIEAELQTSEILVEQLTEQQRILFNENTELKRELVFYQRIMAPEDVINGVKLESLTFIPEVSEDYYFMQLVLMQVQKKKRHIKATVDLVFYGSLAGEPAEYTWNELVDDTQQQLKFSFRYFQTIEASIKFPLGFVPERVQFIGKVKGNRWNSGIKLKQNFAWSAVLQNSDSISG